MLGLTMAGTPLRRDDNVGHVNCELTSHPHVLREQGGSVELKLDLARTLLKHPCFTFKRGTTAERYPSPTPSCRNQTSVSNQHFLDCSISQHTRLHGD